MERRRIFVDIGKVIIDRKNPGGEHSYLGGDHRFSPQIPGAFTGIKQLIEQGDDVILNSVAQEEYRAKDRDWFIYNRFEWHTSLRVDGDHVKYCSKRWQKAMIADGLAVTHVVDDRLEAISYFSRIKSVRQLFLFNPIEADALECSRSFPRVNIVYTWEMLVHAHLLKKTFPLPLFERGSATAGAP